MYLSLHRRAGFLHPASIMARILWSVSVDPSLRGVSGCMRAAPVD